MEEEKNKQEETKEYKIKRLVALEIIKKYIKTQQYISIMLLVVALSQFIQIKIFNYFVFVFCLAVSTMIMYFTNRTKNYLIERYNIKQEELKIVMFIK